MVIIMQLLLSRRWTKFSSVAVPCPGLFFFARYLWVYFRCRCNSKKGALRWQIQMLEVSKKRLLCDKKFCFHLVEAPIKAAIFMVALVRNARGING